MPRCFIAINLFGKRSRIKENIIPVLKELKEKGVNTIHPENIHFTIKFLGELKQDKIQKTISILSKINPPKFKIKIKGLDAFPSKKYIRIIYASSKSNELDNFAKKINDSLLGTFAKEPFVAHLTLGRVSKKLELISILKKYEGKYFGSLEVSSFELMSSELSKEGPKYTILWSSSELNGQNEKVLINYGQ